MGTTNIYALKLEKGKYYIGKATNLDKRINQHFNNQGSFWTKKYPPIKVIEIFKDCSHFDEDKYTIMYMSIYGIDNVRGGSFCSINLQGAERYILHRMICNSTNKCFKCLKHGHYYLNCPSKEDINKKITQKIIDENEDSNFSDASSITDIDDVNDNKIIIETPVKKKRKLELINSNTKK